MPESLVQTRARHLGRALRIAGGLQVAVYAMMVILLPQLLIAMQPEDSDCGNWMLGVFFWLALAFVFVIQGCFFLSAGKRMAKVEFEGGFAQLHRATWVDFIVGAILVLIVWGTL